MIVDSEEEFYPEEVSKLHQDVVKEGLGLLIFAEWYNVDTMVKMKFFDDNTRSWWTPVTGGQSKCCRPECCRVHMKQALVPSSWQGLQLAQRLLSAECAACVKSSSHCTLQHGPSMELPLKIAACFCEMGSGCHCIGTANHTNCVPLHAAKCPKE